MYNFHVGVKVCLRLDVVPNSTLLVEVKSKERNGSWSYRGRVQGNSMGSYQSHNHLSVLQELNISTTYIIGKNPRYGRTTSA